MYLIWALHDLRHKGWGARGATGCPLEFLKYQTWAKKQATFSQWHHSWKMECSTAKAKPRQPYSMPSFPQFSPRKIYLTYPTLMLALPVIRQLGHQPHWCGETAITAETSQGIWARWPPSTSPQRVQRSTCTCPRTAVSIYHQPRIHSL